MATSKLKGIDEPQLEGGISGGASSFKSVKQFENLSPTAERAQAKIMSATRGRPASDKPKLTDYLDSRHYLKSEESLERKAMSAEERAAEKAAEKARKELIESRRQEALRNAKTEGNKTEYPYIEPIERKKGGTVSASRRADGIAQRGKTRGKIV